MKRTTYKKRAFAVFNKHVRKFTKRKINKSERKNVKHKIYVMLFAY